MDKRYPALILLFTVFYYAWLFIFQHDEWIRTLGGNVLSIFGLGTALYWTARAVLSPGVRQPLFWKWIFAGLGFYFVSECIWFWYESVWRVEVPISGFLDYLYLANYFCYLLAFAVRIKQEQKTVRTVRILFDMLITMTVAVSFSWQFIIGTIIGDKELSMLDVLINLSYPATDLALLVAACTFFFGFSKSHARNEISLILFGLAIQIAVDSTYTAMTLNGVYESGNLTDPLYITAPLLLALAGRLYGSAPADRSLPSKRTSVLRFMLPYAGILILFICMIIYCGLNALTIGSLLAIVLLMARQALTLLENQRLYSQLLQRSNDLSVNEQRYRSLFDYYPEAAFSIGLDGCFQSINQAAARMLGYADETELIGQPCRSFLSEEDKQKVKAHYYYLLKGIGREYEITLHSRTGRPFIMNMTNIPIVVDGQVTGIYGIGKDVTEQKNKQQKMTQLAYHDTLTGLPNRLTFHNKLMKLIQDNKNPFAVVYMDLDGFKSINDTLGHDAGDELLITVSRRLSAALRTSDMAARQGGDEFTAVISGISSREEVENIASRLLLSISERYHIAGELLSVTPSIGLSLYPQDGGTPEQLLKKADLAMYSVKQNGKGAFRFYSEHKEENE
ncbi:diguanylate cyclase domain-containing protein [Domibacillus indicus]|uniref:diguanylate cyclase domain-containing protein n=1 Tax=Domibacillus indicus TaxID=1437523 RepID=UPI00069766F9|nr:diguanylate cyclase [Domibacillus indicus]